MENEEKLQKLQKILSKKIGRDLTIAELQNAYYSLMSFITALLELDEKQG